MATTTLVRHVAGIPTATEQRCVRCCDLLFTSKNRVFPFWPGEIIADMASGMYPGSYVTLPGNDCTPHDPHAEAGISKQDVEVFNRVLKTL